MMSMQNMDNTADLTPIAIFPIPNSVCFPGTSFPLHVFEPRYRTMVKDCLNSGQLLAIAHTEKVLSESKSSGSLQEALQSNQTTYKPCSIFSAGRCELLDTLDDGRMYLQIHIESRFTAVNEIQTLPYSVFECQLIEDKPLIESDKVALSLLQQKVLKRLLAITSDSAEVQSILGSSTWTDKDSVAFSFEIFGVLQLDASIQQKILEMTSPIERLTYLLHFLNK